MYKPQRVWPESLSSIDKMCFEIDRTSQEVESHCKLIADQQAIIADLVNRVKLLEEDLIKRSCC